MKTKLTQLANLLATALIAIMIAPAISASETVMSNTHARLASPAPAPAASAESKSWSTDIVETCLAKEPSIFNAALERSRKSISADLNKLKPEEYKKLSDNDDSRVVFMDMTWPKDISYENDHFSNDSDRSYCAKLHKIARDNVASTSASKAAALQAIRDFENCANVQFNGNNERPLPAPLKELVACYREKSKDKR
jgi:hypothetical protein